MDNASTNGVIAVEMEKDFTQHDIPFNAKERKIMCMPHVISLCTKRMVLAASTTPYSDDQDDFDEEVDSTEDGRDVIALTRKTVRAIRASGQRIEKFMKEIQYINVNQLVDDEDGVPLHVPELQLLRDVRTRWDSVYSMTSRFILLKPVSSCSSICYLISDNF